MWEKGIEKTDWHSTEHYAVTKWILEDDGAVEKLFSKKNDAE